MDEVFFYKLDDSYEEQVYDDKLVDMIRKQLEILMDVIVLCNEGKEINIDSFKLRCDDEKVYLIDINN